MAHVNTNYTVFELMPYNIQRGPPRGIAAKYNGAVPWQKHARFNPVEKLQKANKVYRIQGLPNRPKYVISKKKTSNLGRAQTLHNFMMTSPTTMVAEYLEGIYGGAGINNQIRIRKALPNQVKSEVLKYFDTNRSLPFDIGQGYILNANDSKLIYMNYAGKLYKIYPVRLPGASSAGTSSFASNQNSLITWNKWNITAPFYAQNTVKRFLVNEATKLGAKINGEKIKQNVAYPQLLKVFVKLSKIHHPNKTGKPNDTKVQIRLTQAMAWIKEKMNQ